MKRAKLSPEHLRALRFHARRISAGSDQGKGARDNECITCWGHGDKNGWSFKGKVTDDLRDWGYITIRDHDWKNCMTSITDKGWAALSDTPFDPASP